MRKVDVAALTLVVVIASAAVTYYIAKHPLRDSQSDEIRIGASQAIRKLSPREILKTPAPTVLAGGEASASEGQTTGAAAQERMLIVHPSWKSGTTHVEGAYAVTKPNDFIALKWSPLGLDIAFTRKDFSGLWIAGPNSTEARQVVDDKLPDLNFEWAPDGMQIYTMAIDRRPIAIMLSGEKYPIAQLQRHVFEREGNIYVVDEDGNPQRITGSQDRFFGPQLSPDGSRVAYSGTETGLYISTVDGKQTLSVGKGEHPSWLPDSSGIVYDIPISDGARVIDGDLWFAASDGSERTNLTNTPGIAESWPAVSPDGSRIAFVAEGAVYIGKFVRSRK